MAAAPEWPLPQAMLAAALAVTGHETEAHETLRRYLSLSGTTARTIAQWKSADAVGQSGFFGLRRTAFGGTAQGGMPEE